MRIEIISTGDEIVTGLVVDTNAAWFSALLLEQGWQVRRRVTVGDNLNDLKAVLQESAARAEVVLVCGGLGPTADDLTAQAAAEAFDQSLTLFPDWLATIEARYASRGRPMPASNAKQAWLPQGARSSTTRWVPPVASWCRRAQAGSSSPLACRSSSSRWCANRSCRASRRWPAQRVTPSCAASTFGVSESALSDMLDAAPWPAGIELGYRSSMPLIELKLIGHDASTADMDAAEVRLLTAIEPWLVGRGDEEPARQILDLLGERPLTLLEGESRGALLAMCHEHPALAAGFSHTLSSDLMQLAAPAAL